MKTKILLGIACIIIYAGCRKENIPDDAGKMPAIQLDHAFVYNIDSTCIQIANIFTPNADGINDRLNITGTRIASFHLTIYNSANQVVFTTNAINNQWNGYQNTPSGTGIINGKYHYALTAVNLDGDTISTQRFIYLVKNISAQCLEPNPPAFFGDMMDSRYCGAVYNTNESVCYLK